MSTAKESPLEKYMTPIAVLLGAIIIALAFAFGGSERPTTDTTRGTPAEVDIKNVKTDTSPAVGSPTAPVTIAVWFDYQCVHCQNFEKNTLSKVYEEYVTDGKVRILYKDFQFFGEESDRLSAYGRAVYDADPSDFFVWINAVMAAQSDKAFGTPESVDALLASLPGIDAEQVKTLAERNRTEYAAAAAADRAEGQTFGITGTPGSIIGTTLIPGAESYEALKARIDAQLAN